MRSGKSIYDLKLMIIREKLIIGMTIFILSLPFILTFFFVNLDKSTDENERFYLIISLLISIVFNIGYFIFHQTKGYSNLNLFKTYIEEQVETIHHLKTFKGKYDGLFSITETTSKAELADLIKKFSLYRQPFYDLFELIKKLKSAKITLPGDVEEILNKYKQQLTSYQIEQLERMKLLCEDKEEVLEIDSMINETIKKDDRLRNLLILIHNKWDKQTSIDDVIAELIYEIEG